MIVNWRKWGFGFSLEFADPFYLRLWLGPVRLGWKYGHIEEGGGEPAGSTAEWNPERVFPWLGDSEPCPSREEQAYERLLAAGWGIYAQLVAIANITAEFNSNSAMHATDFWLEVTGGQAEEQDLGTTASQSSVVKGEKA